MTDNQMSEQLRKLLNERGVEYEAYRDIKNRCITKWRTYHGAFVFFAVEKEGKLFVETASDTEHSAICTPEQAVVVTLGNDKKLITIALQLVRDHYCYTERFNESCIELERWCHDHGETDLMEYAMALRCPTCAFVPMDDVEDGQSVKLTAEQVREAAKSNSRQYESPVDDGVWIREYDWQAIADELNARAERTCIVTHDFKCSNCGKQIGVVRNCEMYETCDGRQAWKSLDHEVCDIPNFCPNCGRLVNVDG